MNAATMKQQVIGDMDRLGALIVIVARGARELIWERDRLQDAIDIKLAILWGMEKEASQ